MTATERKMAAILAMDVASYSEKMGRDEEGTLRHLRACREIIEGVVSENRGRIFNTAGDAFMIEFSSAISALSAAVDIQKLIQSRNDSLPPLEQMKFRVGVNVGDIIIEGNNLYGEGVNVAARLEGIAEPGGISISDKVYAEVRRKFNFAFEDKGHQELKNIEDPVRVYQLSYSSLTGAAPSAGASPVSPAAATRRTAAASRYKLMGIALAVVLIVAAGLAVFFKGGNTPDTQVRVSNTLLIVPIENLSNEELSKNFANGLTQDLYDGLVSASKGLNVVRLPKRPDDIAAAAGKTGAQYLIDGSLRQAGDKFRLSISLISTSTMASLWSKSFDKKMSASDIFETQDEIVRSLLQEIIGTEASRSVISKDIAQSVSKRGTGNLTAFECVNYARNWAGELSVDGYARSQKCLAEATAADPKYADAWSEFTKLIFFGYGFGFTTKTSELDDALKYIDHAIGLDPTNGAYQMNKASILFLKKSWPEMYAAIDKAVQLAPNNISVLSQTGYLAVWGGNCTLAQRSNPNTKPGTFVSGSCQWQKGYDQLRRAEELDKAMTVVGKNYGLAYLYILWGQNDRALRQVQLLPIPGFFWYHTYSAMIYHRLGDKEAASKQIEMIRKTFGTNKLAFVERQFDVWNNTETLSLYRPVFEAYGFE